MLEYQSIITISFNIFPSKLFVNVGGSYGVCFGAWLSTSIVVRFWVNVPV